MTNNYLAKQVKQEFLLGSVVEMKGLGLDTAISDNGIIEWVIRKTGFNLYVQKEKELKAGIYDKPFLHRLLWRIKNGFLQKRIKRKIRRFIR